MSPTAKRKAPMSSKWSAPTAGARCSTSLSMARARSTCAAISSWATRHSPRLGSINTSHKSQLVRDAVGDVAHGQGFLVHVRRHQVAGFPGEEQQDRVSGLVREAVLRIAGGDQLATFGVVP